VNQGDGSWIYNYLCNQCLSSLIFWVRISIRARCTTLCDKVCQWLATGRWFSPGTPCKISVKKNMWIKEILKVLLSNQIYIFHLLWCNYKWNNMKWVFFNIYTNMCYVKQKGTVPLLLYVSVKLDSLPSYLWSFTSIFFLLIALLNTQFPHSTYF
jgi:hypothetical protein